MPAGFTHFRLVTRNNMKSLTTETALDILIAWLQDNIDCGSGIIFDNDEDKTDSAALLPCIEQAREESVPCVICSFCTRTGEAHSPDFIPLTPACTGLAFSFICKKEYRLCQISQSPVRKWSTGIRTYLLNQHSPHSGCTKEYTVANRHTYPTTG